MNIDDRHRLQIHPDIIEYQEKCLNQAIRMQHGHEYSPDYRRCRSFQGKGENYDCQHTCDANINSGLCTECWLKMIYMQPNVPRRYRGVKLIARPGQEQAFAILTNWLDNIRCGKIGNLFLFGYPGTGKTHAACALLLEYSLTFKTCLYANLTNLLDEWGNCKASGLAQGDIGLLVVDEVTGITVNKKSKEDEFLYKLSTYRWENKLPTVYISNLTHANFMDAFHERTISRMFTGSPEIVSFAGMEDYRGQE